MIKEVHIIAKGVGWDAAPEEGETWGVNDIILRRDTLRMAFHLHNLPWIEETNWRNEATSIKHISDKCVRNSVPLMTLEKWEQYPTSVKYPLDEIIEKFGSTYFGSSIDLMVAYALYENFDIINLYGVNMVIVKEFAEQKPSMEYWIGKAEGMGKEVNVYAGGHSNVMKTFNGQIYGYNLEQFKVHQIKERKK